MEELTKLERLELSLKYSISKKHKELLKEEISKLKSGQLNMFNSIKDVVI